MNIRVYIQDFKLITHNFVYHGKWFEPRGISYLQVSLIILGEGRFNYLSSSQSSELSEVIVR